MQLNRPLRIFSGICAVLALCGAAHATTDLSIVPTPNNVTVGDTFTLDVNLSSDNSNISGFDFEVTFPTFLQVLMVTEEGYFAANGTGISPTIDNMNGVVSSIFDSASMPDDLANPGPDTLVAIQFQAIMTGSGMVAVECDQGNDCADFPMLADNNFNSIPVDSLNPADVMASVPEPSAIVPMIAVLGFLCTRRRKVRATSR